jgi:hypothetical protein
LHTPDSSSDKTKILRHFGVYSLINILGILFKLSQQRNSWIQWDRLMGGSRRSNKPYFSHICYYCFFVSLCSLCFATDENGCAVENFCNTLLKCVYNLHEEIFCLIVYYEYESKKYACWYKQSGGLWSILYVHVYLIIRYIITQHNILFSTCMTVFHFYQQSMACFRLVHISEILFTFLSHLKGI